MDIPPPLFARGHGAGASFNVFQDMSSRATEPQAASQALPWSYQGGASDADNESNGGGDSQAEEGLPPSSVEGIAAAASPLAPPTPHATHRSSGAPSPGSSSSRQRSPLVSRKSPMMRGVVIRGREPPPTQILDFLFLGNAHDARNEHFLKANNICTILNVSHEEYWTAPEVTVHWFKADDNANFNIAEYFPVAVKVLDAVRADHFRQVGGSTPLSRSESQGVMAEEGSVPPTLQLDAGAGEVKRPGVLVHCQKGRSRSATIVMAYLIKANGWTVAEALEYCTKRRPSVEPNIGFISALGDWQAEMDNDERTERRSRQCLSLRNAESTPAVVGKFFEEHVGLVMNVMVFQSEGMSSGGSNVPEERVSGGSPSLGPVVVVPHEADDSKAQRHAPRSDGDGPSSGSAPESQQRSSTQSTCGVSESSDVSPNKGTNPHTLVSPHLDAADSSCSRTISMSESAADDEEGRCSMERTTTESFNATKKEVRLFLVFFSCWENVANARKLLKTQPSLFSLLGNPSEMSCGAARRDTTRSKRVRRPPMHHKALQ